MPSLRINRNTEYLCSIGSDELWVFTASIRATLWGPERASMDVHGSSRPKEDGRSEFRIWHMPLDLQAGDTVTFNFVDDGSSWPAGEVFVAEPDEAMNSMFPLQEEHISRQEQQAPANRGAALGVQINDGEAIRVMPDEGGQCVSLICTWVDHRPGSLRVSLTKNSLRGICAREDGERLLQEQLGVGDAIHIVVS